MIQYIYYYIDYIVQQTRGKGVKFQSDSFGLCVGVVVVVCVYLQQSVQLPFSMNYRASKRQRRDNPVTPLDHESVACVATPQGPISTPLISTLRKEIILSRLEKEIVQGFMLNLSVPRKYPYPGRSSSSLPKTKTAKTKRIKPPTSNGLESEQPAQESQKSIARQVLDSRLCIGINQCTRALEKQLIQQQSKGDGTDAFLAVSLLIVCRDIHPPTIQAHIPYLVRQLHRYDQTNPVLLVLPGKSSLELAHILKIKKCSMICFTKRKLESNTDIGDITDENDSVALLDKYHAKIDSFIDFCKESSN